MKANHKKILDRLSPNLGRVPGYNCTENHQLGTVEWWKTMLQKLQRNLKTCKDVDDNDLYKCDVYRTLNSFE